MILIIFFELIKRKVLYFHYTLFHNITVHTTNITIISQWLAEKHRAEERAAEEARRIREEEERKEREEREKKHQEELAAARERKEKEERYVGT